MKARSPAFPRNRGPLLQVLEAELSDRHRTMLEVGSGPGEHACWLAPRCPTLESWLPSDPRPSARASIDAWRQHLGVASIVAAPLDLTLGSEAQWPTLRADAMLVVNVLHMVALPIAVDVMARAAAVLRSGGKLVIYDCFTYDGEHVSASNVAFAERLRGMGGDVHPIEALAERAEALGFGEPVIHWLPANNQGVVFTRGEAGEAS